ncbi:hypothetical protein GCM10011362_31240 [Marinobacter halophilus]|nr:hypothetical protein GCM10011362_31240 [Marinobacter halophilus]
MQVGLLGYDIGFCQSDSAADLLEVSCSNHAGRHAINDLLENFLMAFKILPRELKELSSS